MEQTLGLLAQHRVARRGVKPAQVELFDVRLGLLVDDLHGQRQLCERVEGRAEDFVARDEGAQRTTQARAVEFAFNRDGEPDEIGAAAAVRLKRPEVLLPRRESVAEDGVVLHVSLRRRGPLARVEVNLLADVKPLGREAAPLALLDQLVRLHNRARLLRVLD